MYEFGHSKSNRCFKSNYPEWSAIVFECLFISVVWSMVGCDRVNCAVLDALDQCIKMFLTAERGRHFCIGIVTLDRPIREGEMMRGDFARNVDAFVFGASNRFD